MRPEHEGSGKRCSTTCETLVYTRSRVRIALDHLPTLMSAYGNSATMRWGIQIEARVEAGHFTS